jgi:hypothetical protein
LLAQRENQAQPPVQPANSATATGAGYLTTRGAVVYLGLGEEAKDGIPVVGSTYRHGNRIVTLAKIRGLNASLDGEDGLTIGWVDLARLGTAEFPLVEAVDPLKPGLKLLEHWRWRGYGPTYIKHGDGRGGRISYAVSDLDEWMRRDRIESKRAG